MHTIDSAYELLARTILIQGLAYSMHQAPHVYHVPTSLWGRCSIDLEFAMVRLKKFQT
jgi:hypothetical protein